MVVHVRDEEELHRKIAAVRGAGVGSFHVIADFDLTLSRSVIGGKRVPSLFGLIRAGDYLSPEYSQRSYALFDKYRPLEIDQTLSDSERAGKMQEWWSSHAALMVESGMGQSVLERVLDDHDGVLKDGAGVFFRSLEENSVPLLIFSSGLGDLIEGFLQKEGLLLGNVRVIANFFSFDAQGSALGYKGSIVHSYNKNEASLEDQVYFSSVKERRNVLLLGDSLGDVRMADGLEHDTIIKIGYCYDEARLDEYLKVFDVVSTDDDTLGYVNELCCLLMKK